MRFELRHPQTKRGRVRGPLAGAVFSQNRTGQCTALYANAIHSVPSQKKGERTENRFVLSFLFGIPSSLNAAVSLPVAYSLFEFLHHQRPDSIAMCQLTITHHATFLDIFADRKGKPHISLPVCIYFTGLGQKHDDGFGCVKITFLTYALLSFVF
jgi:hypothetical protein